MRLIAIDPGPTESAYVFMVDGAINRFAKVPNEEIGDLFHSGLRVQHVVCERIRSYGMPAGAELFETCEWCGRFLQQTIGQDIQWHWMVRGEVKMYLCQSMRAKDANVRRAVMDKFGGDSSIKKGGPLYGIHGDCWAALGVALTWTAKQGRAVDAQPEVRA